MNTLQTVISHAAVHPEAQAPSMYIGNSFTRERALRSIHLRATVCHMTLEPITYSHICSRIMYAI